MFLGDGNLLEGTEVGLLRSSFSSRDFSAFHMYSLVWHYWLEYLFKKNTLNSPMKNILK